MQLAEKYADWFAQEFNCVLGESSTYQNYEIAVAENDPFLSEMAKKHGLLKIIDSSGTVLSWYDFSKGYCEFETTNENLAEIKAFMPLIVNDLNNRVLSLTGEVEAQGGFTTQRLGGVTGQDIDLAGLKRREAGFGGEGNKLDFVRGTENSHGNGPGRIHIEAAPDPFLLNSRFSG